MCLNNRESNAEYVWSFDRMNSFACILEPCYDCNGFCVRFWSYKLYGYHLEFGLFKEIIIIKKKTIGPWMMYNHERPEG